jgi:hypothetical protein
VARLISDKNPRFIFAIHKGWTGLFSSGLKNPKTFKKISKTIRFNINKNPLDPPPSSCGKKSMASIYDTKEIQDLKEINDYE